MMSRKKTPLPLLPHSHTHSHPHFRWKALTWTALSNSSSCPLHPSPHPPPHTFHHFLTHTPIHNNSFSHTSTFPATFDHHILVPTQLHNLSYTTTWLYPYLFFIFFEHTYLSLHNYTIYLTQQHNYTHTYPYIFLGAPRSEDFKNKNKNLHINKFLTETNLKTVKYSPTTDKFSHISPHLATHAPCTPGLTLPGCGCRPPSGHVTSLSHHFIC